LEITFFSIISDLLYGNIPVAGLFIERKGTSITHAYLWGTCSALGLFLVEFS